MVCKLVKRRYLLVRNPELAREVFIREALAANQLLKNYAFLQHNQPSYS